MYLRSPVSGIVWGGCHGTLRRYGLVGGALGVHSLPLLALCVCVVEDNIFQLPDPAVMPSAMTDSHPSGTVS